MNQRQKRQARNEALVDLIANGDPRLSAHCLTLAARSLDRSPLVESQVPSGWQNILPAWSFLWMRWAQEHFNLTGDLALARAMIDAGLETYLTCIDLKQLPKDFAGRRFDRALLADLPASADPCGEKGEFHSCVVAGPMFSRPIPTTIGEIVERDGFAYADIVQSETSAA